MCNQLATDVHEIIPRSQTKDWDRWDNRVTLCKEHHFWVHDNGPQNAQQLLQSTRKGRLLTYYGTDDREIIRGRLFN